MWDVETASRCVVFDAAHYKWADSGYWLGSPSGCHDGFMEFHRLFPPLQHQCGDSSIAPSCDVSQAPPLHVKSPGPVKAFWRWKGLSVILDITIQSWRFLKLLRITNDDEVWCIPPTIILIKHTHKYTGEWLTCHIDLLLLMKHDFGHTYATLAIIYIRIKFPSLTY